MYIESVPNRNSPPAILLRESYRERRKVKKRTLANLSQWPPHLIEGFKILLKGGTAVAEPHALLDITRSLPHGHIAAVLGTVRELRLERTIAGAAAPSASASSPSSPRASSTPPRNWPLPGAGRRHRARLARRELGLGMSTRTTCTPPWTGCSNARGPSSGAWPSANLEDGALVLYDLTSSYLEGHCCPLAKRGKLQIEFGLLCDREGCPVAVEVFDGNTADPMTVGAQIDKLRRRFGLSRVVWVGDRGMLTEARIREEVKPAGLDWISALRSSAIRELVESGTVQMSLFDEVDLIEIRTEAYPGERLMVCRNPLLATERARKREALLQATEALLEPIVGATQREKRRLVGKDKIGLRAGKVLGRYKMAKHFELEIGDTSFGYRRDPESIAREAARDGLYVVRTSLPAAQLDAAATVRAYKSLSAVERAFRSLKTVDLKVRPIYHYAAERVRAHVFLCMLAYYVEWHLRARLKPLLFDDDDPSAAEAVRVSVVAPAEVSESAKGKARRKRTADGWPVHSFRTLLGDLATITRNRVVARLGGAQPFEIVTRPTALQREAFKLLGVRLERTQ